ncbi:MAG: citrate lyase holo-[acyl-carrier protein] synthase [Erysipelothrix sp.]|nr:citrate lyase holo-[acyl-carrier protein] synthase [Erysipelothrix sp.]
MLELTKNQIEKLFDVGNPITLNEVLNARERRVSQQESLVLDHRSQTILVVKSNIPGPIKNNQYLMKIGLWGQKLVSKTFNTSAVLINDDNCGYEAFYVIDIPALEVKEKMMLIEDSYPLGRLLDGDVFYFFENGVQTISRLDARQCFICNRDSKSCGSQRTHSVSQLQEKVKELCLLQLKEEK